MATKIKGINKTEAYEGIFNALGTAIIYYDQDGELVDMNRTSLSLFANARRNFSKFQKFISFVFEHSLDMSEQSDLLHDQARSNDLASFNEIIQLGPQHFYMVRAITQFDKSIIVEISDITQIKSSTDNIRILSEAIHSSQKGIFIARNDSEKCIIFESEAMNGLLERYDESSLGCRLEVFIDNFFPDEADIIKQSIEKCRNGKFWQKILLDDGKFKWLCLNLCAEKKSNNVDMIVGFISDETINKINEHHILQTQKMEAIGKLAGGVAHDFNNILSIVDGYLRLSEAAIQRGENVTDNFARIKKAVVRGSGLTKQLLTFGKHRVSENKIINLCHQAHDVDGLLKPLLGAGYNVHITTSDEPILVKASTDSISQIIMNLVINARDAMPDGGDIFIEVAEEQVEDHSDAVLKVVDTGCGMPPAIMEKIFDPFFTTKEQGKGTGLGLSMVYGIVKQIGATISVESEVDKGTTFTIRIPVVEGQESAEYLEKMPISRKDLKGKTILLAEDEEDLLAIISHTLQEFGMTVLSAKNGQEALVVQDEFQEKIDFLLTDMVMPELGGLKLASLMKEVRPETNIVFMSGYPVRGEISNIDLPSDAIFMAKPVQPDFLRNILEQLAAGESVKQTDANIWQP